MDQQQPTTLVWLTVEQAAARAQVGKRTLYREVRAGRLRAAIVGGRRELRFREAYIDEWLERTAEPREINGPPIAVVPRRQTR